MSQMVGTGLRVPGWMDGRIEHLNMEWGASKPDIMRVAIFRFLNELSVSDVTMPTLEDREKFFEFHKDLVELKKETGEIDSPPVVIEGEPGYEERMKEIEQT